jgi:hypothetical protein
MGGGTVILLNQNTQRESQDHPRAVRQAFWPSSKEPASERSRADDVSRDISRGSNRSQVRAPERSVETETGCTRVTHFTVLLYRCTLMKQRTACTCPLAQRAAPAFFGLRAHLSHTAPTEADSDKPGKHRSS